MAPVPVVGMALAESTCLGGMAAKVMMPHAAGTYCVPASFHVFVLTRSSSRAVHYWRAGISGPPVVLVHGFGVGCWHYEQCMRKLSTSVQALAVDLLGQGAGGALRP